MAEHCLSWQNVSDEIGSECEARFGTGMCMAWFDKIAVAEIGFERFGQEFQVKDKSR